MVDFVGVVRLISDLLTQGYGVARLLYISVKAGSISGVAAARTVLADFEDEGILVTVGKNLFHGLRMTRGGSLVPELLTAAGEIDGLADFEGLAEGFLVHVGDHKDLVGVGVLRDRDDEPVFIKFRGKGESFLERDAVIAGSEGDFS